MKRALSQMRAELTAHIGSVETKLDSVRAELRGEMAELKAGSRRIAASVVRLEGRMDSVEERLKQTATKDDMNRLFGYMDAFSRTVEGAQRDRLSASDAYMRHQTRLDDHEARLKRLEQSGS